MAFEPLQPSLLPAWICVDGSAESESWGTGFDFSGVQNGVGHPCRECHRAEGPWSHPVKLHFCPCPNRLEVDTAEEAAGRLRERPQRFHGQEGQLLLHPPDRWGLRCATATCQRAADRGFLQAWRPEACQHRGCWGGPARSDLILTPPGCHASANPSR